MQWLCVYRIGSSAGLTIAQIVGQFMGSFVVEIYVLMSRWLHLRVFLCHLLCASIIYQNVGQVQSIRLLANETDKRDDPRLFQIQTTMFTWASVLYTETNINHKEILNNIIYGSANLISSICRVRNTIFEA